MSDHHRQGTYCRLPPDDRRAEILAAGLEIARAGRWGDLTRQLVADGAGVSPALVSHYYESMKALRDAVIDEGCRARVANIILMGLSMRHPTAVGLPESARLAAARTMGRGDA